MYIDSPRIKFSDLDKHDVLQLFSVQYGLSEQMSIKQFESKYLDQQQLNKFRFKEWYDVMSEMPEEAWPDMEWLFVIKEEKIYLVVP